MHRIGIRCAPQFAVLSFATVFLPDFRHVGQAAIASAMVAVQIGAMGLSTWSGRSCDSPPLPAP